MSNLYFGLPDPLQGDQHPRVKTKSDWLPGIGSKGLGRMGVTRCSPVASAQVGADQPGAPGLRIGLHGRSSFFPESRCIGLVRKGTCFIFSFFLK